MEIGITQHGQFVLRKVYPGVLLETSEGNQICVCMRDDTFEINVLKIGIDGVSSDTWYRANMQIGTIEKMSCEQDVF